uniref:H15 domain-containing protein n=1 Tax=Salix viminalis TaxID=40686 RepID=A0A6N2MRB1_SALVM
MSPAAAAPSKAKANPSKSKKTAATATSGGAKKPRAYPTYHEMAKEAIVALKERSGSSQIVIAKFIEEKQKSNLPANFKKLLLVQLKKLVANVKLVKVKNSFKLPPKSSAKDAASEKKVAPAKPKAEAKPTQKKAARAEAAKSPAKKVVVAAKKKTPAKKAVKKPKTIKSPVKKAVKKTKK